MGEMRLYIEKIVPIETFTSILLEPSNGSKSTMYFPFLDCWLLNATKSSFSSEAIPHTSPPCSKALMNAKSATTSNFCCSSP